MSEVRKDRPEEVPPEGQEPRYGRRGYGGDEGAWAWWWWVLGIIVIGLIIWWIVAAATPRAPERVATGPTYGAGRGAAPAEAVAIPAIMSDPNRYMGRAVSVRGDVGQVLGVNGFVLQSGADVQQRILVVGRREVLPSLRSGQSVQVTGTVQRFSATTMQRTTGGQFGGEQFRSWENLPAVEASLVTIVGPAGG